jgi:lysine 2,3-aminomutase
VHLLAWARHRAGSLDLGVAARGEEGARRLRQQSTPAQERQAGGESVGVPGGLQASLVFDAAGAGFYPAPIMPDGFLYNPTLRSAAALIEAGFADEMLRPVLESLDERFAVAVPPALQALIRAPDDAIGRQFIPSAAELEGAPGERDDPTGDAAFSPVPGVVHRYPDRALLKPLLICPTYCRFCFRRAHVGPGGGVLDEAALARALDYLRNTPAIREIILTGGDPLMLSPRRLGAILASLESMPHVELLRIHTRVPVADPELVTEALAATLETRTPLWLALHANHAREFGPACLAALARIRARGVPLLGQSVLLRGVNDRVEALAALFRAMLGARVKPYYLHHLDAAPGTSHFHVPIEEGQRLLAALRGRISGMALPTYVLDVPGGFGKVPVGPGYLDGGMVRDPWGGAHALAGTAATGLEAGQSMPRQAESFPLP